MLTIVTERRRERRKLSDRSIRFSPAGEDELTGRGESPKDRSGRFPPSPVRNGKWFPLGLKPDLSRFWRAAAKRKRKPKATAFPRKLTDRQRSPAKPQNPSASSDGFLFRDKKKRPCTTSARPSLVSCRSVRITDAAAKLSAITASERCRAAKQRS